MSFFARTARARKDGEAARCGLSKGITPEARRKFGRTLGAAALALALAGGLAPLPMGAASSPAFALAAEGGAQVSPTPEADGASGSLGGAGNAEADTPADGILITLEEDVAEDAKAALLSDDGAAGEDAGGAEGEGEKLLAALEQADLAVTDRVITAQGDTVLEAAATDGKSATEAAAAAEALPGVAKAQPNYVYELIDTEPVTAAESALAAESEGVDLLAARPADSVNDPFANVADSSTANNQYWLYNANLNGAWRFAKSSHSVTIAVLDTGATTAHEDLAANVLSDLAWDAASQSPLDTSVKGGGDASGHGTAVAGVACAAADNARGIAGASYNANLLPVKITSGQTGTITTKSVMAALSYLTGLCESGTLSDLRVINMSFGQYFNSSWEEGHQWLGDELMHDALKTLRNDYGVALVCAGGNKAKTENIYPADYEECVSVMALNADGSNWYGSDYNAAKDISAPGSAILSTEAGTTGGYSEKSGTSLASPLVAGTFALMFAAVPDATVSEAEQALYATAKGITDADDHVKQSGTHGAIDAGAAVEYLMDSHARTFADVSDGEWFASSVGYVSARHIMNGVGDTGLFMPSQPMTRAMAAQVLYNYLGRGEVAPAANLADVDQSEWYAPAINWCVSSGCMTGYSDSNLFGVGDALTREQIASMFAKATGADTSSAKPGARWERLTDADAVSDWAVQDNCVVWAVESGLMSGLDNGDGTYTFDPTGNTERCMMAEIMRNALTHGLL